MAVRKRSSAQAAASATVGSGSARCGTAAARSVADCVASIQGDYELDYFISGAAAMDAYADDCRFRWGGGCGGTAACAASRAPAVIRLREVTQTGTSACRRPYTALGRLQLQGACPWIPLPRTAAVTISPLLRGRARPRASRRMWPTWACCCEWRGACTCGAVRGHRCQPPGMQIAGWCDEAFRRGHPHTPLGTLLTCHSTRASLGAPGLT